MPVFDRHCVHCGWERADCYHPKFDTPYPCPECGLESERIYTGRVNVIPDTFSTPLVDTNMGRETQVFYSRSERKAAMLKHGVRECVRHVEFNHSDKSPHTTRWY